MKKNVKKVMEIINFYLDITGIVNNKSRSIHNLTGSTDQSFYQNLSVYRTQNQSQPNLGDR